MTTPHTPTARRMRIADLIAQQPVSSQHQLRQLLADEGVAVTQATLSRDLVDLGAIRARAESGRFRYVLPTADDRSQEQMIEHRVARALTDLVVRVEHSGNMVVVRTPPGAAQYLASALDRAGWSNLLGTVAGDDTVFMVARDLDGGVELTERILAFAEKGHTS